MSQLTFFDEPPKASPAHARNSDPITSHEAAAKVNAEQSRGIVLKHLRRFHKLSAEQLISICRESGETISDSRVRGALSELVGRHLVEQFVGEGFSARGNRCTLYKAKGE